MEGIWRRYDPGGALRSYKSTASGWIDPIRCGERVESWLQSVLNYYTKTDQGNPYLSPHANVVDSKKKVVLCNIQLQHVIPARRLLSNWCFPVKSVVTLPRDVISQCSVFRKNQRWTGYAPGLCFVQGGAEWCSFGDALSCTASAWSLS